MEDVLEYLRPKKTTGLDNMKKLWLVLATVLVCMVIMTVFPMMGQYMSSLVLVAVVIVVYVLIVLLRRLNIEYEYILVDGVLDVDVIRGKRSRKRLVSITCREIELMAWSKNPDHRAEFFDKSITKQYRAVFDSKKGGVYRILFRENGEKVCLSFQPPADFLEAMKKTNPRNIHVEQ